MDFFRRDGKRYTEEEINDLIDERMRKEKMYADGTSGNDFADAILRGVDKITDKLENLEKKEKGNKSGGLFGGDFGDMITLFNRLNIDSAARYGIDRATFTAKGPIDSTGNIGGTGYDPTQNNATSNNRILKWSVNAIVWLSRAQLAFFMFTTALIKWEILDIFMGGNGGDGEGFDLTELMMLQLISGGLGGGSSTTSGTGGAFDFLGGLFGSGSVVLDASPYYAGTV